VQDPLRADTLRTMESVTLTTACMRTGALRTVVEAHKATEMARELITHHPPRDSRSIHAHGRQV